MDIEQLTALFKWCSIINGALLVFWTGIYMLMPDFVYRIQRRWFVISRETFDVAIYAFLGLFKVLFLIFNLVPYIALSIIR